MVSIVNKHGGAVPRHRRNEALPAFNTDVIRSYASSVHYTCTHARVAPHLSGAGAPQRAHFGSLLAFIRDAPPLQGCF
jgi:hypothetical protein